MDNYTYSPPPPQPARGIGYSPSNRDTSSPDFAPNPYKLIEKLNQEALDRHRMNSNAFYQQDSISRRNVTPPADHPSLRYSNATPSGPHAGPRSSQLTTLSPFINAGRERSDMMRSPSPLYREQVKLVPDDKEDAVPTNRAIIEEYHERAAWKPSDKQVERTPVYVYSPKPAPDGFDPAATLNKSASSASGSDKPRSPRKKFLDRLNFGGSKATPKKDVDVPVISTPAPSEGVAPKAAALLGTSSSKYSMGLIRSPSKKEQNARKSVDVSELSGTRSIFSSVSRKSQGQSWISKTTANTDQDSTQTPSTERRVVSQPEADTNDIVSALSRPKSLHYYDPQVPPTPPSKDTPPEVKVTAPNTAHKKSAPPQHQDSPHPRLDRPITDETPSKPAAAYMASNGRTPVRGGGYAHRKTPAMQPKNASVHSMRAEFVANYHHAVDAANAGLGIKLRPDGLLPGGLLAPTCYSPPAFQVGHVYSPSVYGSEWGSAKKTETLKRSNTDGGSPKTPSAASKQGALQIMRSRSFGTLHSESSGQIPVILQTPSRGVDNSEFTKTPTNKPAVAKRVSFEPTYADIYSSEVLHPYNDDTRLVSYSNPLPTELFTTSTQHLPANNFVEADEAMLGAERRDSNSSAGTIDMLARNTPEDKNVVRQLLNGTSTKFDLFGVMKPDLSPPQKKQWEDFVSVSAIPSPLHFNPRKWEEEYQKKIMLANKNETNDALHVNTPSTADETTGEVEAKELNLRQRFIASSEDIVEMGAEHGGDDDAGSEVTDDGHVQEGYANSTTHAMDHIRGSLNEMHNLILAVIQNQINTNHEISMLKESMVKVESRLEETADKIAQVDTKLDTVSQQTSQFKDKLDVVNDSLDKLGNKVSAISENYDAVLGSVVQWAEGVNIVQHDDDHAARTAASIASINLDLSNRVAALEAHDKLAQRVEIMEAQVALHDRVTAAEQDIRVLRTRKVSGARRDISGTGVAPTAEMTGSGLWKRGDAAPNTGGFGRVHVSTAPVAASAGGVGGGMVANAALLWPGGLGCVKK